MISLAVEQVCGYGVGVTSPAAPTADSPARSVPLAEVEAMVAGWCDGADPARFCGADAVVVVERLAGVVRRLQAKQASVRGPGR